LKQIIKAGLLVSIIASIVAGCAQRSRDFTSGLELEFQGSPLVLTQGINTIICRLKNTAATNVLLRGWFTNELDEPPNFLVFIREKGTSPDFIPCYDASMLYNEPRSHEFVLKGGAFVEFTSQVVFNRPPGDYEMFAKLREQTNIVTGVVGLTLAKGKLYQFPSK